MNFKNFLYILTCLSFSVILGAAVYEHTAIWPSAFSAIPRSLVIFQGAYKLNAVAFWMPIHPVTFALFITTLMVHWRTPRRKFLIIPTIGYAVVLLITFAYFVPELIDLTGTPFNDVTDASKTQRAQRWITLSFVRGASLFALAVVLYFGLTKPESVCAKISK